MSERENKVVPGDWPERYAESLLENVRNLQLWLVMVVVLSISQFDALPPDLEAICTKERETLLLHLGHIKYSDQCLGRFVAQVEQEFPNSLFVITGDHEGHNFLHGVPTEYERTSVPLILYGKEVLRDVTLPANAAGSHVDIAPTLVNLAAPPGFRFASLGKNLLQPQREFWGISNSHMMGADFIINCREEQPVCHPLAWAAPAASAEQIPPSELMQLGKVFRAYHALSGWLGYQQTDEREERLLRGPGKVNERAKAR